MIRPVVLVAPLVASSLLAFYLFFFFFADVDGGGTVWTG
jgi:hypothetical protein